MAGSELEAEFEDFVSRRSVLLFRSAYLLIGDAGQAEDALQVTLSRVAGRWEVARVAPDAYARRVLVNVVRDRRRRRDRRVRERSLEEERSLPCVTDHADRVIVHDAMISALRRLPVRQLEVIVLRFFADLSVSDTAAAIGSSEGTVKSYTSRALARLRELLDDDSTLLIDQTTEVPGVE